MGERRSWEEVSTIRRVVLCMEEDCGEVQELLLGFEGCGRVGAAVEI